MGDPLSIASGVAGIVSLGLTVYKGVDIYFSAIKDRGKDIQRSSYHLRLLGTYIEQIRSIEPTLRDRHAEVTDPITEALLICKSDLEALEKTIDKLKKVQGTWEKSKSAFTYPFSQAKLTQVQDRLFKATASLDMLLPVLTLRETVTISEGVGALRNDVQDNNLIVMDTLRGIQTSVEASRSSVEPAVVLLNEVSTAVKEQEAVTSELIQRHGAVMEEKLDKMAQAQAQGHAQVMDVVVHQRQAIEAARENDAPQYLRNAELEKTYIQVYTADDCPCKEARRKPAQLSLQRYKLWGGLTIFHQFHWKGNHKRGCRYYKESLVDTSTKITFTYTGLRCILSWALNLTVERRFERGEYSIKPSLRPYSMRETSKAFEVFNWKNFPQDFSIDHVEKLITKLKEAYTSGDVSPLDVDQYGRNTAHVCIMRFSVLLDYSTSSEEAGLLLNSLARVLVFLSEMAEVDIFVGENHNGSMLEYLVEKGLPSLLPHVYDVLKTLNSDFDPGFDHKPMWNRWDQRGIDQRRHLRMFRHAFHLRPDIIEDLGYGELFLAVAKRDISRLQELINSTHFVKYLDEKDFFRHNVLHLCASWKDGLKLLLKEKATNSLINEPDSSGSTPLHYALVHSGHACSPIDDTGHCGCDETTRMLLETDCRVAVDLYSDIALENSSTRAAGLLLKHLRDRRERLRNMAMKHLSKSELRDLGVTKNELPDTTAAELWNRLQAMYKKGTVDELNDGLNPLSLEGEPGNDTRQSIFHSLTSPRDAEMAFAIGFRSIDEPNRRGATPILYSFLHDSLPLRAYEERLIYAGWLIAKGAKLDCSISSLKFSAAHRLAQVSAWWARAGYVEGSAGTKIPPGVCRALSAVCDSKLQSSFPCPCSPNELSRPLHHFFVTALEDVVNPSSVSYHAWPVDSYPKAIHLVVHLVGLLHQVTTTRLDMAFMAKSIIHILTMECLGIRHLEKCHDFMNRTEDEVRTDREEMEWDYMLDEGRCLIEELEKLTGEFEQEFISQKVSIEEFLWNHWLKKMREKWKKRKPLSKKQKQDLGDIGVDMESDSESDCDLYDPDFEGESVLPILARGRLMREMTD